MRLSWNEIRVRAAKFAEEWQTEGYEKGQTQLFYRDFFDVFGVPVRKVARFEEPVKNLGAKRGYIDLFWKGVLLVEQKSVGRNLYKAKSQAFDYFPGLRDDDLPRYLLLSDFQTFELYDLDEDEEYKFTLADLPKNVEKLGFIMGVQKREFKDQDPVNIKASELVGKLHDALEESGYVGADLEQFLVRIVFCLFADDTGIFDPRDIFFDYIETRTREDGSDLGPAISQLFQVLDTPTDRRSSALDEDLVRFPYVNGDLFRDPLPIPSFNSNMRKRLIDACRFDWSEISPAIFGALFQSVMEPEERRAQGAHYTTEKNIMKVIQPLFLDDLRAEFKRLKVRRDTRRQAELRKFQDKLASLRFFDPACGCGNFLIIAYRELRQLEIEVLKEIQIDMQRERDSQMRLLGADELSKVDVDQFFGIEIGEFPAKIAETAMWMMDHIMNNRLSLEFGQVFARIPLRKSPHIRCGDALETDWADLLAASECNYVFGNPPFVGAKYQSPEQRAQIRRIANLGGSGGTLDYVSAWFIRAAEYTQNTSAGIGFVATNSITQGEQVAQLWPIIFGKGLEIEFAHRTFAWGSDARGKAHVHVVVLGLLRNSTKNERRLFSYDDVNGEPHESLHSAITAYLFDGSQLNDVHLVVSESSQSIHDFPPLKSGSQPIDDRNYIFDEDARDEFLKIEPEAEPLLRPYIGSREFLQNKRRWILALQDTTPHTLRKLPHVVERMKAVKSFRSKSKRKSTLAIASSPEKFNVEVIPNEEFLVIPKVSSERREWVPIGWVEPPTVPSDLVFVLARASKAHFAILSSSMHMSWVRHIGGRLKSDFRYSIGLIYNTFPMPDISTKAQKELPLLVNEILAARAAFPDSSLADLYDPDVMPTRLRKAHNELDERVDNLYKRGGFQSDRARVEYLFSMYEQTVKPLAFSSDKKKIRKRKKKRS